MKEKTYIFRREAIESPESGLERQFIAEYLISKGFSLSDLDSLTGEEGKILMAEACRFAALKLAEIDSRSKFCRKIAAPH